MTDRQVPIIYVDLDGVCTDLLGDLYRLFGKNYPPERWPRTYHEIEQEFGFDERSFWQEVECRNPDFWSKMSEFPWVEHLFCRLNQFGTVVILTAPSRSKASVAGKIEWIRSRFNASFRDYIITSRKSDLAQSGRYLIDDSPTNVAEFSQAGGYGVLFPQPWNTPDPRPMQFVEDIQSILVGLNKA